MGPFGVPLGRLLGKYNTHEAKSTHEQSTVTGVRRAAVSLCVLLS